MMCLRADVAKAQHRPSGQLTLKGKEIVFAIRIAVSAMRSHEFSRKSESRLNALMLIVTTAL
jgi:hypothetical protein